MRTKVASRQISFVHTAYIYFHLDDEAGWYVMKEPDGTERTWPNASDAFKYARSRGWRIEWLGDDTYKPYELDFDK